MASEMLVHFKVLNNYFQLHQKPLSPKLRPAAHLPCSLTYVPTLSLNAALYAIKCFLSLQTPGSWQMSWRSWLSWLRKLTAQRKDGAGNLHSTTEKHGGARHGRAWTSEVKVQLTPSSSGAQKCAVHENLLMRMRHQRAEQGCFQP